MDIQRQSPGAGPGGDDDGAVTSVVEESQSHRAQQTSSGNRLLRRIIPVGPVEIDDPEALRKAAQRRKILGSVGVPFIGILLIVIFAVIAENFLTGGNIKNIFAEAALPMIVAIGLTVCLTMGEFDLSLNGVAGLGTVLLAVLLSHDEMAAIPAVLIVLGAGIAVGAFNGVLVGYFGVAALIVTIAVNSILDGWQFVIAGSEQIFGGFPPGLVKFARGQVWVIPDLVLVAAGVAIVVWVLVERTTFGRHVRAVGGNSEAARIAGVNIARVKLVGFIICAFLAVLGGLLFAARQTSAYPLSGLEVLLPSFAACFIGAAMFKLGEFNVPGTIVGVLITQITTNGLALMNVATYASYFIQGVILIVALLFARAVAGVRTT